MNSFSEKKDNSENKKVKQFFSSKGETTRANYLKDNRSDTVMQHALQKTANQSLQTQQLMAFGQTIQRNGSDDEYDPADDQEFDDAQDLIDDAAPGYEIAIPYGKHQFTTDGKTKYWTPATGYVNFDNPTSGAAIKKERTVNITKNISAIPGVGARAYAGNTAKSSRGNHNTVANIIRDNKAPSANGSNSPKGYTWHHNAFVVGQLDLLDRTEHAHIKHKGGHSAWGR